MYEVSFPISPCDGMCAGRRGLAGHGGEPVKLTAHMWIRYTHSLGLCECCAIQPGCLFPPFSREDFHMSILELPLHCKSWMKEITAPIYVGFSYSVWFRMVRTLIHLREGNPGPRTFSKTVKQFKSALYSPKTLSIAGLFL